MASLNVNWTRARIEHWQKTIAVSPSLQSRLTEILQHAERDVRSLSRTALSEIEFTRRLELITRSFARLVGERKPQAESDLAGLWQEAVSSVYRSGFIAEPTNGGEAHLDPAADNDSAEQTEASGFESARALLSESTDVNQFLSFLRTALVPMLVMKGLILFFGLNYSRDPGQGYGWGLVLTILVSLFSFSYFIWSQTRPHR